MSAMHYHDLETFDASLHVGQRVRIAWSSCYYHYHTSATITKVNAKSVLAVIDEEIRGNTHLGKDVVIYPKGHSIKAPRMTAIKQWTAGNCVMPLEEA